MSPDPAASTVTGPVGGAFPDDALLRRVIYEPRDGALDRPRVPDPVRSARAEFIDNARAICIDPKLVGAKPGGSDGGPPTITANIDGVPIDITLEPGEILETLTALYCIDGWGSIRRLTSEVDRRVKEGLEAVAWMASQDVDVYGVRASDPTLDPNQGSDVSGVPRAAEVAGLPGALQSTPEWSPEVREAALAAATERWQTARATYDSARELLALAVVNALQRLEGKANQLAVLRLNEGRNLAAAAWARYGVERVAGKVVHALPTPYIEYRYELSNEAERTSLRQVLQPLVEYIAEIKRLEGLRGKAVAEHDSGAEGGSGSDAPSQTPTPEKLEEQIRFTRRAFEDILIRSRQRHPVASALMVGLKPGFSDRDMYEVVGGFLSTVRDSAERYEPPASRVAELATSPGNWSVALDIGPESWLLNQVSLDGSMFDPLTQERLLSALLFDDRVAAEPFETAVLVQYLDSLQRARGAHAEQAEAEASVETLIMVLQIGLLVASVFVPALAPIALVVDSALAVRGAVQAVHAVVRLEPEFRSRVQEQITAVAEDGTLADMAALGDAVAAAPAAADVALLLLKAGVSLRATAGALRLLPTRRLMLWNALDLGLGAV